MLYKKILCIFVVLKTAHCCYCNKSQYSQNLTERNTTPKTKLENNDTLATIYNKRKTSEDEISANKSNETRSKIDVGEYESNESEAEHECVACPALKNGITHNLDRIEDVWQTVYYRTRRVLSCFKIYIRKTTIHERRYYAHLYGNFNGSISWIDCLLEIRSSAKHFSSGRKHFLQGSMSKEVFENIIILEGTSSEATLSVESPDQWMVLYNLLIMRDCMNGDIIIFTRAPHEPRFETILHSLTMFGEESPEEIAPCINNERISRSVIRIPKEI